MNATSDGHRPAREATRTDRLLAALGGLLAAYVSLAVADLVASRVRPEASPVVAVGGAFVDRTPAGLKDWAIRTFGENDKAVLQLGILLVLALLAVGIGLLALRRRAPRLGGGRRLRRPRGARRRHPPRLGVRRRRRALPRRGRPGRPPPVRPHRPPPRPRAGTGAAAARADRRSFLVVAASTGLAATGAAALGRAVGSPVEENATASRAAVQLPRPASPAPPVPAGARLAVPGISPFTTPNRDFYRVDTALVVPKVDANRWRLRLHGTGVRESSPSPCGTSWPGGRSSGTSPWPASPTRSAARTSATPAGSASPRRPAARGRSPPALRGRPRRPTGGPLRRRHDHRHPRRGRHGRPRRPPRLRDERRTPPLRARLPRPHDRPRPLRLRLRLQVDRVDRADHLRRVRRLLGPARLGRRGPVKTQSRIDTPAPSAAPPPAPSWSPGSPGPSTGASAGSRCGSTTAPGGRPASPPRTPATPGASGRTLGGRPGRHTLTVRATDGTGTTQPERRTATMPDGAQGWHSVVVTVEGGE